MRGSERRFEAAELNYRFRLGGTGEELRCSVSHAAIDICERFPMLMTN